MLLRIRVYFDIPDPDEPRNKAARTVELYMSGTITFHRIETIVKHSYSRAHNIMWRIVPIPGGPING